MALEWGSAVPGSSPCAPSLEFLFGLVVTLTSWGPSTPLTMTELGIATLGLESLTLRTHSIKCDFRASRRALPAQIGLRNLFPFRPQTPETKPPLAPSKYLAGRDIGRTGITRNRRTAIFVIKFVGLCWR